MSFAITVNLFLHHVIYTPIGYLSILNEPNDISYQYRIFPAFP